MWSPETWWYRRVLEGHYRHWGEATQKKLLLEADLTFAKVIEIAQGMEVARDNMKHMQSPTTAGKPVVADVQHVELL